MVQYTIRMPDEMHDKLRWKAYKERRSQHEIILEILRKGLEHVQLPEEEKK